jgi:cell division protein ZapA
MDPAADRKSVRVTIFHQMYTLSASGDPGEVEALAHSVDELMVGIASRAGNVDSNRVAVLTCLHLADRLRAAERELTGLKDRIDTKAREFSMILDQTLP